MDVSTAVVERRSIRCFKSEPIPEKLIREILDLARWSPSWGNTQPWEFYVVTGSVLKKFKEGNRKRCMERVPETPEVPMPVEWPEIHKKRRMETVQRFMNVLDITREDSEGRMKFYADLYYLFDAPCLIVTCVDRRISVEYAMLDVGLINQTICLLAHERGLGSCVMAAAVSHAPLLRELLELPDNKRIAIGIAMGYPDKEAPINRFQRERAGLDDMLTWRS